MIPRPPLSLATRILLAPARNGLCAGRDNEVEILVRIQAPDAPAGHAAARPAQAVALVVDRSGSMAGAPLAEAQRCAAYVIGRLRPTDAVSLVQFDRRIDCLCPAAALGDGAALRTAIAGIQAGGNTNLHGGWLVGAESLGVLGGSGLRRVILLSDGQANEGLTQTDAIAAECAQWAARGVTTSTYGLGRHFNEDLMVAMARAGGGNHYYGDAAEDLMDPFQQEFELLANLCLRDLRLAVTVPDGVEAQLVNELPRVEGGWRLPDLAWGAEAWALLRLSVPVTSLPAGLMPLLKVTVEGRGLDGEAVRLERAGLALPVLAPPAFAALVEDELVARRRVELAAAQALHRMRDAAARYDWDEVDRLLDDAGHWFAGNEWVAAMLQSMKTIAGERSQEQMMKESRYSSEKLRNRLVPRDEAVRFAAAMEATDRPSYLRRKPSQGKGGG